MPDREYFTISVIIPCYQIDKNYKYLNDLLFCISNQKGSCFKILEIILINDSPGTMLFEFLDNSYYSICTVINNEKNMGQAYSRNIGAKIAKGHYLHFIDQDDLISLDFYENVSFKSDIIITNCFLFNQKKNKILAKKLKLFFYQNFKKLNYLKFFLIFDNIALSPGQLLISKDIFFKVGGFPVLTNYGSDDFGLMYKLSQKKYSFCFCNDAFFFHRLHENQGKNHLNMNASKIEFINNLENSIFNRICSSNFILSKFIKKVFYILFNNRL